MKVTVIVRVYNAEKTIKKCLKSILEQTLSDIEILCINDASQDQSLALLEAYAAKDNRIKVINNKENKGVVRAGKIALAESDAQYIGFVDADDWIEPNMYEILYNLASTYNADMVTSGCYVEGNYLTESLDDFPEGIYEAEQLQNLREKSILNMKTRNVGMKGSLCTKIYRRENIQNAYNCLYDDMTFAEDKCCIITVLLDAKSVYVHRKSYYHYIMQPMSLTHSIDSYYLMRVGYVYQYFISLYHHPNFSPKMRMQVELYITEMLYKGINSRLGFENENLFWLDFYYLDYIPQDEKLWLYGIGELAYAYLRQLRHAKRKVIGVVDFENEGKVIDKFVVQNPQKVEASDYILITIKNAKKAAQIKQQIHNLDILDKTHILWFEQTEIFWKYAEVNGWFD